MTASRVDASSVHDPAMVKRLRRRAGFKQSALAQRVGISRAHMCNIENGKVKEPGANILAAIARELGCTVADLERLPEQPPGWSPEPTPEQTPDWMPRRMSERT